MTTPPPAWDDAGRLPADLLTVVLGLSLWVASGSLVLAVLDGLGDDPARRLVVGAVTVAMLAVAFAARTRVTALFSARPGLVLLVAAAQIGLAAIDGVVGGAFVAVSLTSIGMAVVVARTRTVWLCVAVLLAGYLAALAAAGHTPTELADRGQLGGVLGALLGYPVAALLFLGLRARFTRFLKHSGATLEAIRTDGQAFTPALGAALRGEPLGLPAPPPPGAGLTPAERRVVEALAQGKRAQEIAYDQGVKESTIRSHIKAAKKKAGARTQNDLAALAVRPDWEPADG